MAPPSGAAAEPWVRARTEHFDLLTNASEAEARQAAASLEQFRRLMARLFPAGRPAPVAPVVVLAFRDAGSFRPLVPLHEGKPRVAAGFYQGGTARSYIAVKLPASGVHRYDALYHEWAHLALDRSLPAQPAWLSEGLAEMYSAWRPAEAEALVGLARPEHLRALGRRGLLPLEELLRADYTSDLYSKPGPRHLFDAASWAFAHYLMIGRPGGAAQLQDYLDGVMRGLDPAVAFGRAFREDARSAQAKLQAYLAAGEPGPARVPLDEPASAAVLSIDAPAAAEVDYLFGDLLLHQERARDARRHLSRALKADPGLVPAREALAQVALRQARWDEARGHLRAALQAAPESPLALYQSADALVREAAHRGQVLSEEDMAAAVAALEKSVAGAPHFTEAIHLLARLKPSPVHRRIVLLEAAFTREPHRADVGITLAGLYARANDVGRAASTLLRARDAARDDDMRFLCSHLLRRANYVSSMTAEAHGTLRSLECLPGGGLNFVVDAEGSTLRLHTPSPVSAMLYGPDGEPLERDLVCGSHAETVTARYRRPGGGEPAGADGMLLSLSFPGVGRSSP